MPLSYDPEYFKAIEPSLNATAPKPARHDIATRRQNLDQLGALLEDYPRPSDVDQTTHIVKTTDGYDMTVTQFTKQGVTPNGPAILYVHGGGYIGGSVKIFANYLAGLVSQTSVSVFAPEYRLAPEHPFPTPVEDNYAALLWLQQNSSTFQIDPTRLGVFGDSAGGGLAAGLVVAARDRGLNPPLKKQILVYPMIDDRNLTPNHELEKLAVWSSEDNITGWSAYLGYDVSEGSQADRQVSPFAAAARVESVVGLPQTYIEVGTLDHFRQEDMKYAMRLMEANINVEFHLYDGVPHAFETLASQVEITKISIENRARAMKGLWTV